MSDIVATFSNDDPTDYLDADWQVSEKILEAINLAMDADGQASRSIWVQSGSQIFQVSRITVTKTGDDEDDPCEITIHIDPI